MEGIAAASMQALPLKASCWWWNLEIPGRRDFHGLQNWCREL